MSRPLTATRLLDAWEDSLDETGAGRAVALLARCRELPAATVSGWSIAARDAALFELRIELFGTPAAAIVDCPGCGERLDVELDLGALRPAGPVGDDLAGVVDGRTVAARRPSSVDLAVVGATVDEAAAPAALVRRCVTSVLDRDGSPLDAEALTGELEAALRAWMAEQLDADDVTLAMSCSACRVAVEVPFDIGVFVVDDVDSWARRTLAEVHALALAYGWSQADVLALSARRRAHYLDLLDGAGEPWPTP